MTPKSLPPCQIVVQHAGQTYCGGYYQAGPLLHVYSAYGSKSRPLVTAADAKRAAEALLAKIVQHWTPPMSPSKPPKSPLR